MRHWEVTISSTYLVLAEDAQAAADGLNEAFSRGEDVQPLRFLYEEPEEVERPHDHYVKQALTVPRMG